MTSILAICGRISHNQFKCHYVRNQKLFIKFLLSFQNLHKKISLLYLRNYWLQTTLLLKSPESPLPEHPWVVNVLMSPKHYWNFPSNTFILLIHRSKKNWVGKRYPWFDLKFYDYLLTFWLSLTGILVIQGRIFHNQFKCNYLRNWNLLSPFHGVSEFCIKFCAFWKKKIRFLAKVFVKLFILNELVM